MKVRPAVESDGPRWGELRRRLWPDCSPARHELEMGELLQSDAVVLLAENPGEHLVGFAEVSIRRDHVPGTSEVPVPYLEAWYVLPEERGQGHGRALIEAACAWAVENGFRELASDAELENTPAIGAHLTMGFREVGRGVHFVRFLQSPPSNVEGCTEVD